MLKFKRKFRHLKVNNILQIDHCDHNMKQKARKKSVFYMICDMHIRCSRKQVSVHVSLNVPVSESSGTCCCVIGWVVPTFWGTVVLSSSRVKQSKTPKPLALLTLEDEGFVSLICWEPLRQWHNITSQKTWIICVHFVW